MPDAETASVAFKAERNGQTGIYLRAHIPAQLPLVTAVEQFTTPGQLLDPQAPVDSLVSAAGVERDGFRNGNLAITASMLWVNPEDPEESLSWGGIYVTDTNHIFGDGFEE